MIRAAIAIADAEGPAALSMRRLAADLDADPMSPYSYITGLTLIAAYSIGDACRAPVMGSG